MPDRNPSVWFAAPGKVEVRWSEIPEPGSGEVLIRTRRTLISNGTELTLYDDRSRAGSAWSEFARFPRRVGYSNAGEVIEVGSGVDREWIGKRVACRGNHAGWIVTAATDLRPIPDSVSDEEAAFATLAGVVMNGLRRVDLRWGESVAVFGLGLLGQLCARVAAVAGAGPVFGIELSLLRLSKLPAQSFVYGLPGGSEHLMAQIKEHHPASAVDVAVEATGVAGLIPQEVRLLRECGRLLLLGSPDGPTNFDFHDLCNRRSISIVGAHGFSQPKVSTPDWPWTSRRHGELFLQWLAAGRLTVSELVTHHFPFERAAEAYAMLAERGGDVLGVVFDWQ
jgi:2-desacetyl-2-hydroxyethyl bacteriochlorophyllide A dehydrogenase